MSRSALHSDLRLFNGCIVFILLFLLPHIPGGHAARDIELSGNNSFLEFPPFDSCIDATIFFEFQTEHPNALLLYTDDPQRNLYIEITLVGGRLKLMADLLMTEEFTEPMIFRLGTSLHRPRKWHSVRLTINRNQLQLDVDDARHSENWPKPYVKPFEGEFHRSIYFGGLPPPEAQKALKAASRRAGILVRRERAARVKVETVSSEMRYVLWTTEHQPRFFGTMRNFAVTNCTNGQHYLPHVIGGAGTQFQGRDWCVVSPNAGRPICLHSGLCTNTEFGPRCDCKGTGYKGRRCEEMDSTSVATFDGQNSFISTKADNQPMYSLKEYISFHIKTRQKNAFLFYTGNDVSEVHMLIYMRDGLLNVKVRNVDEHWNPQRGFGSEKGIDGRLDDNIWHKVNVTWKKHDVSIEIDGEQKHTATLRAEKPISSRLIYLGGMSNKDIWNNLSPEKDRRYFANFKGCLRQVIYSPESLNVDLISLARKKQKPASYTGNVIFDQCKDQFASEPITFRTNEAFLKVRANWRSTRHWSISFRFKTTEEGGLMLYQKGNGTNADYLAFELRQSELYLLLNAGSGTKIYEASLRNVTEGREHHVQLKYTSGKGNVLLDGKETLAYDLNRNSYRGFREMNMNAHIFVGSLPSMEQVLAPHELWSAKLRKGYVGCFWDLRVDSKQIDLVYETRRQKKDRDSAIGTYCSDYATNQKKNKCPSTPCFHGGICKSGWDRFLCDCTKTMWTGYKCQDEAPVLRFDGSQYMMVKLPMEIQSEAEDVTLRFKTKEKNGLLFGTHSPLSSAQDRMELLIKRGKLVLVVNFGKGNKTREVNPLVVSDGRWHFVSIRRRKLTVKITLDDKDQMGFDIDRQSKSKLINMRNIQVGYYKEPGHKFGNHFIGHMMHFSFNGINYFELAKRSSPPNIEVTADFTSDETIRPYPINFLTEDSYIRLPGFRIYDDVKLTFLFRTKKMRGILLFNSGMRRSTGNDYIFFELVAGSLNFVASIGGTIKRDTSPTASLHDGRWHNVTLMSRSRNGRFTSFIHYVDGQQGTKNCEFKDVGAGSFQLRSTLYIGYAPKDTGVGAATLARTGFVGCVASISINRPDSRLTNPFYGAKINKEFRKKIIKRCSDYGVQCSPDVCYYGGQCIQQWRQVRCNCEMTSFTGVQCQQVSSTVEFGPAKSHVRLEMLDRARNTRKDELAFGIQTEVTSATLVHIVGEGQRRLDYIRVDIVDKGIVQVNYNMGSDDFQVTETKIPVNDGRYHIIRLIREGPNTYLRVDDGDVPKIPKGVQLSSHFNKQKWIYLGASKPVRNRIRRTTSSSPAFSGYISGLVFNGIPVTDLITGRTFNPLINITKFGPIRTYNNFKPNLKDFPPPLTNLTDSRSTPAMQDTMTSNKESGSANSTDGALVTPHLKCRRGPDGNCRNTGTSTSIVIPNLKIKNPEKNPNAGETSTPPFSNAPQPPLTHNPITPSPTAFPLGLGGLNVWLVVAIACGGALVLLLVVCIIYRCRHKADEGSYSVEHHQREFGGDPACKPLRRIPGDTEPLHMNGGATPLESVASAGDPSLGTFSRSDRSSNCSDRKKKKKKVKPSRKETREWYV